MKKIKLGIFETHPIQYKIPWFRELNNHPEIDLTVFFCMVPDAKQQGEGFGVEFQWDVPLLEGYHYQILNNIAEETGTYHFKGCDTPEIYDVLKNASPKFDAVIINGWVVKACLQALWACNRLKIPAILRCEANNLPHRTWWKTVIHKQILKRYSAFIAIGTSNKEFYTARGIPETKISMGYYCVENERIKKIADLSHRAEVRLRYNIPQDVFCFVFSGKFEEKKRPMDIILSFQKLVRESIQDLHLLMVGDGDLKDACQDFCLEHKLPVTFSGFVNQSEIPSLYKASDCLVLASDYGETWGLVINEGMVCGLPAIVSDHIGSHFDLIHDAKTGYTFKFNDIESLKKQMLKIIENKDQLQIMKKQVCEHIQKFSIQNLTAATFEALKKL
ncbi:MAG: glycosyltransferase family 4 protein [Lentisphaeria bacterium]|nr:glycosyltransferase family 4 protein [Lentisphaeria bacterium]